MSTPAEQVDVVVVGAGTAGLNAAYQLARVGCSVVVLERRSAGKGGARWCNGIVDWQFERAGLDPPTAPELRVPAGGPVHLVSPSGCHRFTLAEGPVGEADMRLLGDRLQALATEAGAQIRWDVTDLQLQLTGDRPTSLTAATPDGLLRIEARLFVDAAGRTGVLRRQIPALAADCPDVGPEDLCSAQQLIIRIDDRDGALRYLDEQGAAPDDTVLQLGIAGGYSTTNIKVEASLEDVSVLAGSIPALGHANGADLIKQVRADHPWMGETVFGGGALIPLRRVYDRFTAPGIALVGDAACQVMPGHGSGIGLGLIAGTVLAEAVGGAEDPGGGDELWRYQASYLREFGGIFGAYDAVRRMSVKLGSEGIEELFATGIFSPGLVLPGLDQRLGLLSPAETASAARALAGRPRLAKVVVPALAAMAAAPALFRTYPRTPTARGLATWSASSRRLLPVQG